MTLAWCLSAFSSARRSWGGASTRNGPPCRPVDLFERSLKSKAHAGDAHTKDVDAEGSPPSLSSDHIFEDGILENDILKDDLSLSDSDNGPLSSVRLYKRAARSSLGTRSSLAHRRRQAPRPLRSGQSGPPPRRKLLFFERVSPKEPASPLQSPLVFKLPLSAHVRGGRRSVRTSVVFSSHPSLPDRIFTSFLLFLVIHLSDFPSPSYNINSTCR